MANVKVLELAKENERVLEVLVEQELAKENERVLEVLGVQELAKVNVGVVVLGKPVKTQ